MKQRSLADADFALKPRVTRRQQFLTEMERVVPWARLVAVIEPFYPKGGNGRPPMPLEAMRRIHFLQQWFARADSAMEEGLVDIPAMRASPGSTRAATPCRTSRPSCASGIGWRRTAWPRACSPRSTPC